MAGMASHGLCLFSKIASTYDHNKLDFLLTRNLRLAADVPLLHRMDLVAQEERRRITPSTYDVRERSRELMKFVGDRPEDGKPAVAWVVIWRGRYSSLFGDAIPKNMKRWGYVIWDVQRIVECDAKPLLKYQWRTEWPRRDPRRLV